MPRRKSSQNEAIVLVSSDEHTSDGTGDQKQDELSPVIALDKPCQNIYSKSCKCKKDSPSCLCGIIPGPGSYRKKGLWQKDSQALVVQGANPADSAREADTPCGLANLGATCYANGALQCLFTNLAFRQGLFNVEPPVADNPILGSLRRLFARMQAGAVASADPSQFSDSVELARHIQQDAQEFFSLLLGNLEPKLKLSSEESVRTLISRLFRGSCVWETRCKGCGKLSESSHSSIPFQELNPQVAGFATLEDSLLAMQAAESMEVDYVCGHCGETVKAISRQQCIKSVPPYLCLQLQRFVYDMKEDDKVKVTDKISFPTSVDLRTLMPSAFEEDDNSQYELAAILIHKGRGAHQGHYVAHVKEEGRGVWWRCDDDTVTKLEGGPASHWGDLGNAPPKKAGSESADPKAAAKPRKPKKPRKSSGKEVGEEAMPDTPGGEQLQERQNSGGEASTSSASHRVTSSNAYMLLYRRTQEGESAAVTLPPSLAEEVEAENASFRDKCEAYKSESKEGERKVEEKRARVRHILEMAPHREGQWDVRLVSSQWLRKWADSLESVPTDNTDLLCQHQKGHPDKIRKEAKAIKVEAWDALVAGEGGNGPALSLADVCQMCASQQRLQSRQQQESDAHTQAIIRRAEADHDNPASCQDGYFISKTWFAGMKKRGKKNPHVTNSPTEGITCPHGNLMPVAARKTALRFAVSPEVWHYCEASWREAHKNKRQQQVDKDRAVAHKLARQSGGASDDGWEQPPAEVMDITSSPEAANPPQDVEMQEAQSPHGLEEEPAHANGKLSTPSCNGVSNGVSSSEEGDNRDQGGGENGLRAFPVATSEDCPMCLVDVAKGTEDGKTLKGEIEREKQDFAALTTKSTSTVLEPGCHYSLLPAAWLFSWRNYLSKGLKGGEEPPSLCQALQGLLCQGHSHQQPHLAFAAPSVVKKRGRWRVAESEVYEVVDTAVALRMLEHRAAQGGQESLEAFDPEAAHPCLITASFEVAEQEAVPYAPYVVDSERISLSSDGSDPEELPQRQNGQRPLEEVVLSTVPPVCQQAIEERQAQALARALEYSTAEVTVELVEQASLHDAPSERKSKRSRKGRCVLSVTSATQLSALRIHVSENLGLHPRNCSLHLCTAGKWSLLQGDDLTLKDLKVLPDSELRVVNTKQFDDQDVASFVNSDGTKRVKPKEVGFGETLRNV